MCRKSLHSKECSTYLEHFTLADIFGFLNLNQHSQTSAFLDHIVIRKNLVQIVKFTKVQKMGAERGAVTFQLVSEVRGLPSKSQKIHKIEGRGLPMASHNL